MSNGIREERITLGKIPRNVLLVAHAMASGEQCKVLITGPKIHAYRFCRCLKGVIQGLGMDEPQVTKNKYGSAVRMAETETTCVIFTSRVQYDRWYAEYCLDDFRE